MPAENLTRLEAIERAELVEVHSYSVELDLQKGEEVFAKRGQAHQNRGKTQECVCGAP